MTRGRVVVIGAGIAGLAAAFRLRQAGVNVTVLEATDRPGGRMTTDIVDGYVIERGVQWLPSSCSNMLSLISEVGLDQQLRTMSPWGAIVRRQVPRRIWIGRLAPLFVLRLVGLPEAVRLARHTSMLGWPPVDDYGSWANFDDNDAAAWFCDRHFGPRVAMYLESFLGAFTHQKLEETSRAVPLAGFAYINWLKCKPLTLARGLGSLPEALASRLDVRFRAAVESMQLTDKGVEIRGSHERITVDRVILATTASAARGLFRQATELEQRLMGSRYSSTVNVCIATNRTWHGERVPRKTCALLIPRVEGGIVSSVTVESFRDRTRVPHGELLSARLRNETAIGMMKSSNEEIVRCVVPELETYFPGLSGAIGFAHVVRWPEAAPKSPVGRIRSIAEYRQAQLSTRRVLLAGDYMGLPCADSAAESGIWAANRILSA